MIMQHSQFPEFDDPMMSSVNTFTTECEAYLYISYM